MSEHNTVREVHLHNDMKGYVAETDAICTFFGKPLDTRMVTCCNEKLCGRTNPTPHGANPLNRLTYSKQRKIYLSEKRILLSQTTFTSLYLWVGAHKGT